MWESETTTPSCAKYTKSWQMMVLSTSRLLACAVAMVTTILLKSTLGVCSWMSMFSLVLMLLALWVGWSHTLSVLDLRCSERRTLDGITPRLWHTGLMFGLRRGLRLRRPMGRFNGAGGRYS